MIIRDLFCDKEKFSDDTLLEKNVTGISVDSRTTSSGDLFIALDGREDGARYAAEAVSRGAVAVVNEKALLGLPNILVEDTRLEYARLSAVFYGNPSERLKMIAVVGTNGKTTTAVLIYRLLRSLGKRTAVIGTLGTEIDGVKYDTDLTTPDPDELHRVLKLALDAGVEYVIMEVSAHAIYYKKIFGIRFALAVFTNFSQDHLDFFGDMNTYREVKKSFFTDYEIDYVLTNNDDSLGREIASIDSKTVLTYAFDSPADAFGIDLGTRRSVRYTVNVFDKIGVIKTGLFGRFNAYNSLAAVTAACILGLPFEDVVCAIREIAPVDGRYNVINGAKTVIIDYAHTPDGLENILREAKAQSKGKVISVFGCGGNRDKDKRKIMGKISSRLSDLTIVTTDNSRLEDPYEIMDEIASGIDDGKDYFIIRNREDAIFYALSYAGRDDVVVLAGKGAEKYVDEGGVKIPYSDIETVKKILGTV